MDGRAVLVAGALSSDAARSKASAPDYDIGPERAYGSYKELLASEAKLPGNERVDFISIATPNHTHFEIAKTFAESGEVDAVICLGVVIRGETSHYDLVAGEAARGVAAVHAATGVPASFGVVTAENLAQALDRAGGKSGNKGADAALAAVEMISLLRAIRQPRPARRSAAT